MVANCISSKFASLLIPCPLSGVLVSLFRAGMKMNESRIVFFRNGLHVPLILSACLLFYNPTLLCACSYGILSCRCVQSFGTFHDSPFFFLFFSDSQRIESPCAVRSYCLFCNCIAALPYPQGVSFHSFWCKFVVDHRAVLQSGLLLSIPKDISSLSCIIRDMGNNLLHSVSTPGRNLGDSRKYKFHRGIADSHISFSRVLSPALSA